MNEVVDYNEKFLIGQQVFFLDNLMLHKVFEKILNNGINEEERENVVKTYS